MDKLDGKTMDLVGDNVAKLKELFPDAFAEGKIDFNALKTELGGAVDADNERYSFSWHGKQNAKNIALKQSTGTLRLNKTDSKNWDTTENLFIEGDNLEVLRVLQESYRGKIKMIYIDPPYNTGKDFVYHDDFKDNIKNYKEQIGESMRANPETSGHYHTNWLNMMYPRLRLAKSLLATDGVIFISIDDHECSNLKKIADEVFGEDNFVVNIVWQKKYSPQNDATYFSIMHDHILCYAKNKKQSKTDKVGWNRYLLPRTEEGDNRYKNPDNDPRGNWKAGDFTAEGPTPNCIYEIVSPKTGKTFNPPRGKRWVFNLENYQELIADNRIWFGEDGNNVPSLKRFKSEVQDGFVPNSIWFYQDVGHTQEGKQELNDLFENIPVFDYPKPTRLIKRILQISSKNDDIALDFFAGSSPTADAVMQLNAEDGGNRKFIMVQIPEVTPEDSEARKAGFNTITDIGKERIRRAGEKIKADNAGKEGIDKLDIGFKVFTLDETNLTQWDPNTKDIEKSLLSQLTPLKEGRSDDDAVYEIMLKYGIDLTTPITELNLAGKKVFSLADNYLLICLEKKIGLDVVEEMAKLSPQRAVFYDDGFADDTVKANAEQTLKKAGVEEIMVI